MSTKKKLLDLKYGNPAFMFPYWETATKGHAIPAPMGYTKEGLDSLKKAIIKLHKQYKNVDYKDKYLVIGSGATQLLAAAIHVIESDGYVTAPKPYFPRFPGIAGVAGSLFIPYADRVKYSPTPIITSPNNPTGKFQITPKRDYILDASYNWPQYTQLGTEYSQGPIIIFSAAKALGLASSRVGWAFVESEEIAKKMQEYIEMTTSGVSVDGQVRVQLAIQQSLSNIHSPFSYGKQVLEKRWKLIRLLSDRLPFKILSDSGMFLWIYMENIHGYLQEKMIDYMQGQYCGMQSPNYARINIGCSDSEFNELIERLK